MNLSRSNLTILELAYGAGRAAAQSGRYTREQNAYPNNGLHDEQRAEWLRGYDDALSGADEVQPTVPAQTIQPGDGNASPAQSFHNKPVLLDLFCGAGGCAKGYQRAGFEVYGVDINPQPNYCGETFAQADALHFLDALIQNGGIYKFDAVHASPPCQAFTTARVIHGREHPDLLTPCRKLLKQTGLPWVIENVPGSPMRRDLELCGSMFNLGSDNGGLIRHRWFEFWEPQLVLVPPCQHREKTVSVFGHGGHIYHGVDDWREVMGIEWMKRDELAQAIPPAYTELIGREVLMPALQQEAKAA